MATYDGSRLVHCDDNIIYVDNGAGQFTQLTATQYQVPGDYDGSRVRFIGSNENLYFNTSAGIYKMQSLTSAPILAGGPQALGGWCTVNAAANVGPLPNVSAVAYRILWEYTDENNNLIRGVPSNPLIANNGSASNNAIVTVTFTVPTTVDTTWNYRIYRSNYGQGAAGLAPGIPDDNCQLVFSSNANSAQISARQVAFVDNVADIARGETIYTTAQGVANAEYAPPYSQDLALYKGSMFYGGTKSYQQLFLTLQTDGTLQSGDNVTFWQGGSQLFTVKAGATENASTGTFKLWTGNSAAVNIDMTAQSLVNVVNFFANNTVLDAYYLSVINVTETGNCMFQLRSYNDTPFYATSSNATSGIFSPNLPASGNNINTLSNDTNNPNYLYFSKSQQPEAVPLNYWLAVGSANTSIKRLVAARDVLFVVKDDGIYCVSGNDPTTFTVYPLDVQQTVIGPNNLAVLNNLLYFVGAQGVVQMDQSGDHNIISIPIQQTLMQYTTNVYPNFAELSWGMAYQAQHKYILSVPTASTDEAAQVQFVFDYVTNTWVTWARTMTCGIEDTTTKCLWYTNYNTDDALIYQERKNLNQTDYCDEMYGLTITGNTSTTVLTVNAIPVDASVGDSLYQPPYLSVITGLDSGNNRITVSDVLSWNTSNAAANVAIPIDVTITTTPIYANDPTQFKQYPEFSIIVDGQGAADFYVDFTSDTLQTVSDLELTVPAYAISPWGVGYWGVGLWGGGSLSIAAARLRSFVPRQVQKCNWLAMTLKSNTAFSRVAFSGVSVMFRPISTRQR